MDQDMIRKKTYDSHANYNNSTGKCLYILLITLVEKQKEKVKFKILK